MIVLLVMVRCELTRRPVVYLETPKSRLPVPRKVIQTWKSWDTTDVRAKKGLDMYLGGFDYRFYDDNACLKFLKENYGGRVLEKYMSFSLGAHRADLFRYCYLYLNGGIYMDIKTRLVRPVAEVFPDPHRCYSVLSYWKGSMYQGILAVPPGHPVMRDAINNTLNATDWSLTWDYLQLCYQLYAIIAAHCGKQELSAGLNRCKPNNWYLYHETRDCPNNCSIANPRGELMVYTRFQK
jgi:mannosyltransferase OCH1-like enzyme